MSPSPGRIVRLPDATSRTSIRLAIGLIVAVGAVAAVWLMGELGFRLGFAPCVRVPELSSPRGGLATGTLIVISVPRMIILAGMSAPGWLMLGFVLVAIPAAGLSAARPVAPRTPAALVFSRLGAVAAGLDAAAVIWWTASDARNGRIADLPWAPAAADAWLGDLQTAAGLDAIAVVTSALWAVLVMRLAIPGWLRALAATASFFALAVVTVAMSITSAAAAQIEAPRSVVLDDAGSLDARLLLGYAPGHAAVLRIEHGATIVELVDRSARMTVIGRQSIVAMLRERHRAGVKQGAHDMAGAPYKTTAGRRSDGPDAD